MVFIERCTAAGIGDSSNYEGYPVVDGRVFSKGDGTLKAYSRREDPKPWKDPLIEDKTFDSAILAKVQAIEDGKLDQLTQAEQDAIAAAELAEAENASAPGLVDLDKRLKAIEAALAQ